MIEIDRLLRDEPLRREVAAIVGEGGTLPKAAEWSVSSAMVGRVLGGSPAERGTRPVTEAVIREFMRPVLLVKSNRIELPRSGELRKRLVPTKALLEARLPSVGRIEFVGQPQFRWGGTGWVISDNVIVTNRHVAQLVARSEGRRFVFKLDVAGTPMQARIDFREEYVTRGDRPSFEVRAKRVLFVETDHETKPDVAFLELEPSLEQPPPIPIADGLTSDGADVAVVGYPARDPRGIPSEAAAHRIFGDIYEVKRFAPGKVLIGDAGSWYFTHDATTLGGNSGSVVLDLATGAAVGLHFMGELADANYAVNARTLLDRLGKLKLRSAALIPAGPAPAPPAAPDEAPVADYADRDGFDTRFLGSNTTVPLPSKVVKPRDLLFFPNADGKRESVLRYRHYSLAMSKKRKVCLWSAVNIDGSNTQSAKRTAWKIDPRIDRAAQLIGDPNNPSNDVYGDEPRFARGHMTRREDPIWGPNPDALQGNSDSMHLTNAVPQMQPFNAGIWNGLEDYALLNARQASQRISVITGPILNEDDPTRYGVQVPVEFWKIIAFIHDTTNRLTATGYIMSQASFLRPEEFVYGQHETYQYPIKLIEKKTGLSFGTLRTRDPLKQQPIEAAAGQLTSFDQIVLA